jgi:molybdenum-dependent DNA-binding transcriptional regulator ModE
MQWVDRIGSRLKLRDLHILLTVVHRGSMAKAAAALAISQPAVSKAIADMEHMFGLRLLDRSRTGIEPTAYGRALVMRGQAIFDELKHGVEELAFLSDPSVGRGDIILEVPEDYELLPTQGLSGMTLVTVPEPMMADLRKRTAELLADFMKRVPSSQAPIKAYLAELKRA